MAIFEEIKTPEEAYWLGFIVGDGCVFHLYKKKKIRNRPTIYISRYGIQIAVHEQDADILEKFRRFLEKNSYRVYGIYPMRERYLQCRVESKELYMKIVNKLTIPLPVPEHLVNHFLRGLLDSDGSIFIIREKRYENPAWKEKLRPCITFSGRQELITWVAETIEKHLQIKGRIERVRNQRGMTNTFNVRYRGLSKAQKLLSWLYMDSNDEIRLRRKYELAVKILNWNNVSAHEKNQI